MGYTFAAPAESQIGRMILFKEKSWGWAPRHAFKYVGRSQVIVESDVPMKDNKQSPIRLVGHYTAAGALAGLLVGALEGIHSFGYPSPPVLLKPNVSNVILFLGPLLDGLAAGFLGLIIGLFVASRTNRIWRLVSLIIGVCLVAALILAIAKDPGYAARVLMGTDPSPFGLAMRAGIFLALVGAFIGGRLLPLRPLSVTLAAAFAILIIGVRVCDIRPSMHRGGVAAMSAGGTGDPNIILITLDTVRADHFSLYGYGRQTTPNLDKWARKGVVFENAIAPSSWTLPSHASIFTGLLPHQHGADVDAPLDPSWWTLGDVLSSRGYETAGFTSNFVWGGRGWGLGNGFETYDNDSTTVRHNLKSLRLGSLLLQQLYGKYVRPQDLDRRDASQINRDVLGWFHYRSPRPFYIFINYFDVHEPYLIPPHYAPPFGDISPWVVSRIRSVMAREDDRPHLSARDQTSLVTSYDNCLAFLDKSVGELLDSLSHSPGWENTIVIITSDHGEGFGEHGTYNHGYNLYREVLHVPLIIIGPKIPAGLRISNVVRLQELFETVLQLSGMDNPPFQRASLQRFWRPGFEPGNSNESVVSELSPEEQSPAPISLTTSEWQYLHDEQGNEELYNWVSDPSEKLNLAKSPEYQEVLKDLQVQLRATVAESLRPWRRPEYLSALGGSDRTVANVARSSPVSDSHSTPQPQIPIGASQAFFPRRTPTSNPRPPSTDQELLQSLPYH